MSHAVSYNLLLKSLNVVREKRSLKVSVFFLVITLVGSSLCDSFLFVFMF